MFKHLILISLLLFALPATAAPLPPDIPAIEGKAYYMFKIIPAKDDGEDDDSGGSGSGGGGDDGGDAGGAGGGGGDSGDDAGDSGDGDDGDDTEGPEAVDDGSIRLCEWILWPQKCN